MKPLFLFQRKMTPIRKLLLMKAVAWGKPLVEYTATGNPVTFETNVSKPLKQMLIPFSPVQSGSGDPSPENVRPISGWDSANVSRTGKNLFDKTGVSPLTTVWGNKFLFKAGTTYCFSIDSSDTVASISIYDETKTKQLAYAAGPKYVTYTPTSDIYGYPRLYKSATDGGVTQEMLDKVMLEIGSSRTDYSAYFGSIAEYEFPQEAGTVYGGMLTVNKDGSGELVVDSANIASYNGETLPGEWLSDRDVYSAGTTPTIGAQVVYKLATPQTYQLTPTPTQITALLGDNTIWSDTNGDMTVKYLKKG